LAVHSFARITNDLLISLCVSNLLTLLIIVYAKICSSLFNPVLFFFFFEIGASLVVNSSWKNPSGEWHVGYKFLFELLTGTLTSRLKVKQYNLQRKKKISSIH
jgi:hypothetical protein